MNKLILFSVAMFFASMGSVLAQGAPGGYNIDSDDNADGTIAGAARRVPTRVVAGGGDPGFVAKSKPPGSPPPATTSVDFGLVLGDHLIGQLQRSWLP